MSTKKLLGALALSVLLPGVALAQVTATFGAGRVYEPTCTHPTPGTIGNPIYANAPNFCTPHQAAFLTQCDVDGTNATPQRNQDGSIICSERINDVNASGQLIQTDPTFPFFTTPGQWVLEEDPPGVVNLVAPSGTAAFTVLNLDLTSVFGDVLFIISSGVTYYTGGDGRVYGTSLDGSPSPNGDAPPALPGPTDGSLDQPGAAPGTGAPSLFYPSPLPSGVSIIRFGNAVQERTGCLVCFDNAGFCSVLIDTPAGEIRCGDEIQAESDPGVRYMPTLISNDGWDSFGSVDNGDSHVNANGLLPVDQPINPGGFVEGEGILNNADDIGAATGGSILIVKGFRGRECSTMNRPPNRYDPRKPISGHPDPDCDDVSEWVLGLGSNDADTDPGVPGLEPGIPCEDLNADNSCTVQIAAPAGATGPGDCENYCTTDVTLTCTVNGDCPDSGQCRQAVFTPENLCVKPGPESLTSSALVIQSTDEHEVFPVPGTIVLEETPGTLGTCDGPIPIDPDTGNPFGSPLVCAESANCAGNCNLTGVVCIDDQFCPPLVDPVTMEVTIDSCSVDSGDPARQPAACLGASPSTLSIPLGSRSGLVNKSFLNLDIATIGVVLIQSATGVLFDGATGVGSPALVADWDNGVPYNLYGCLRCTEITETACTQIGLGPSGENICGARIQFAPPENRPRNMPDWTGVSGNFSTAADRDTQRLASVVLLPQEPFSVDPVTEEPVPDFDATAFYAHGEPDGTGESINSDVADTTTAQNGGAWVLTMFRDRHCGTTAPDPCDTNGDGTCDCEVAGCLLDDPASVDVDDPPHGKPDRDCDRVADEIDNCPDWPNTDQTDSDDSGRGDACKCSDQDGNGTVNVDDILAINAAIFQPLLVTPLCDGNNDGACDVNDILAANSEIFSAGNTASCYRAP